jgi:hypothetical protein
MSSQNAILSNILFLFIFRFPLLLSNYNFILYEFQFKQKEEKTNLNTLIVKPEIKVLLTLFVTNAIETSL